MTIRIKNIPALRRRLSHFVESLQDGPVYIAKEKRVRAILLDISDYYSLLGELEDLNTLLHDMGRCDCGSAENKVVERLSALERYNEGD